MKRSPQRSRPHFFKLVDGTSPAALAAATAHDGQEGISEGGYPRELRLRRPPLQQRATKIRLLLFFVAEKAPLPDHLRHLGWHHFIPALVAAGDALEHVTRKDRQIFRVEIIE